MKTKRKIEKLAGCEGAGLTITESKINELVEAVNILIVKTDFMQQDLVNRVY